MSIPFTASSSRPSSGSSSPNISETRSRCSLIDPVGVSTRSVEVEVVAGVAEGVEAEVLLGGRRSLPLSFSLFSSLCAYSFVKALIFVFLSSVKEGYRDVEYEWPRFSFSTNVMVH